MSVILYITVTFSFALSIFIHVAHVDKLISRMGAECEKPELLDVSTCRLWTRRSCLTKGAA